MINMSALNALIRAEVLDHIDPDTCTASERMVVELEVLDALSKKIAKRVEVHRKAMIDTGVATYVEGLRENAPTKSWWLENEPDRWLDVRRVSLVKTFKVL
jgi:hypothetical protein